MCDHLATQEPISKVVRLLEEALSLLDSAQQARAAIAVSHALALIDGTEGALPAEADVF